METPRPTHRTPATGMAAWGAPDPSQPSVGNVEGGREVAIAERTGEWARIVLDNGWTAWVDARLLEELPPAAAATMAPPPPGPPGAPPPPAAAWGGAPAGTPATSTKRPVVPIVIGVVAVVAVVVVLALVLGGGGDKKVSSSSGTTAEGSGGGGDGADLKAPERIGNLQRTASEEVSFPDHMIATYIAGNQVVVFSASRKDDAADAQSEVDEGTDEFMRLFDPDATSASPTRDGVKYSCVAGKPVESDTASATTQCHWASGKFFYTIANNSNDIDATVSLAHQSQSAFSAVYRL